MTIIDDKTKKKILPKITDWTSSQDEYRCTMKVKNMDFQEFFWLTPINYKIVMYGILGIPFIIFMIAFLFFESLFSTIGVVLFGYLIFKQYHYFKKNKDITLYDLMMREYTPKK